ncbi:NAD(P)-dependent oxidoreductase [Terrabacter sp. NPDC080008]|uniref:NAD(P)-dependent oxidoreductase n=1 Tax=Terrabacter sp. NPDC080008 TaxID=3155176 RepID=UPI00344CCFB2
MARVGFIGLGIMGRPMATNLLRAGVPLAVWNRSRQALEAVAREGARALPSPAAVFAASDIVLLMLANEQAVDEVLRRGTPEFAAMVAGRTVVPCGTTSAAFSVDLERDVIAAGGRYVEAPVSGSRVPAERRELVGLLAGSDDAVVDVAPLLETTCRAVVRCGAVPGGLGTKLAVNLYLCTMVAGLAEAYHLASGLDLDLSAFQQALDLGPMASAVSTLKLAKLVERDFAVQAAIRDVHRNTELVAEAARSVGAVSPLLDLTRELFRETEQSGAGALDMAAVVTALESRDGIVATRHAAAAGGSV